MKIAEAVRELIIERAKETGQDVYKQHIWQGDPDFLQGAYLKAGRTHSHALNDTDAVMAAVRRSPLFERAGRLTGPPRTGAGEEVSYVAYKLVKPETK